MLQKYDHNLKFFIKKTFLFLLPVLVVFFLLDFLTIFSGELYPLNKIIEKQKNYEIDYIFGRKSVNPETIKYKFLSFLDKNPEVLALGSSRVLQIRKEMFNEDVGFYNGGSLVVNLRDIVDFVDQIPENSRVKYILFGVDSWWFNSNNKNIAEFSSSIYKNDEIYNWRAHINANKFLVEKIFNDIRFVNSLIKHDSLFEFQKSIGFGAIDGNGFRADGSRQYGTYIVDMRNDMSYIDREGPPVITRVKEGFPPFSFNEKFSEESLGLLQEFLEKCKNKGIIVIGFAPAYSKEVFSELKNSDKQRFLFNNFQNKVPEVFLKFGFDFYDFSDISVLNIENVYMFDGFHAGENAMARILIKMSGSFEKNILKSDLSEKLRDKKTTPIEINWK